MRHKRIGSKLLRSSRTAVLVLAMHLALAATMAAQQPFSCTDAVYLSQDESATLFKVTHEWPGDGLALKSIASMGLEINNMGFRRTDGLLYALALTPHGHNGVIRIDSIGDIEWLGAPLNLPYERFDAGDISVDGVTMYINRAGFSPLYKVDLTADTLEAEAVTISGHKGLVHDWAVDPLSGLLYGGDSTDGQIAVLDPVSGIRVDFGVPGLPTGVAFGGAWFDYDLNLVLYGNDGTVFVIDPDPANPSILLKRNSVRDCSHNDGAACPPEEMMTLSLDTEGAVGWKNCARLRDTCRGFYISILGLFCWCFGNVGA